jgi:hypothetical protein
MDITPNKARLSAETFDEFLAALGDLECCENAAIEEIVRDQVIQSPSPEGEGLSGIKPSAQN